GDRRRDAPVAATEHAEEGRPLRGGERAERPRELTIENAGVPDAAPREPERRAEKARPVVVAPAAETRRQRGEELPLLDLPGERGPELGPEHVLRGAERSQGGGGRVEERLGEERSAPAARPVETEPRVRPR